MKTNFKQTSGRRLERFFKGPANHRRIDILLLLDKEENISLGEISEKLNVSFKTISGHTKKLTESGLLNKRYADTTVLHSLSPYGKKFVKFIKSF